MADCEPGGPSARPDQPSRTPVTLAGVSLLEVLLSLAVMSVSIVAMLSMNRLGARSQETIGLLLDLQQVQTLATQVLSSPDACTASVGPDRLVDLTKPQPLALTLVRQKPDGAIVPQPKPVIATGQLVAGTWKVLDLVLGPAGTIPSPCGNGCWDSAVRLTLRRPEADEGRVATLQDDVVREFPVRLEVNLEGRLVRCATPQSAGRALAGAVSCPTGQYLRGIEAGGAAICENPLGTPERPGRIRQSQLEAEEPPAKPRAKRRARDRGRTAPSAE